jgi:hypothetical protein
LPVDEMQPDAPRPGPRVQRFADELRTVVDNELAIPAAQQFGVSTAALVVVVGSPE